MITTDELKQKAREFEVGEVDIQRDYILGWILVGIYSQSRLGDLLVLKGGNALRKGYFEHTRYSDDLDFGTETEIEESLLQQEMNKICEFISARSGIKFGKDAEVSEKFRAKLDHEPRWKVYEVKLSFYDLLQQKRDIVVSITMDVTRYDKFFLDLQRRPLIHPYSDATEVKVDIRCLKLEEILASKLKCLLQRQRISDLYDYVRAIYGDESIALNKNEIIQTFLKMTIYDRCPGAAKNLLIGLPFAVLGGYWDKYVIAPKNILYGFDDAVRSFSQEMEQLFSGYPNNSYFEEYYCPAHVRNPIMEAGRTRTLLEVEYDGITRTVEPYSLVYKEFEPHQGREYFYVFDRSGGKSGKKCIKSWFPHKVTSIKNTEEVFEPQYPVEIAKASEFGQKTYFGKPFSERTKYPSKARNVLGARTVTCSYCYREFSRVTKGSRLRPHKNRYGGDCPGRTGY